MTISQDLIQSAVFKHVKLLYFSRFRTKRDREKVYDIYVSFFGKKVIVWQKPPVYVTKELLLIEENITNINNSFFYGDVNEFKMFVNPENSCDGRGNAIKSEILKKCDSVCGKRKLEDLALLEKHVPILSALSQCVKMNWLAILVSSLFLCNTFTVC